MRERMLTREQEVVHLPEAILRRRLLRRFRGDLRMRMDLAEWEMSKYESKPISELALDLLDRPVRRSRVWALVVAVLHERDCWASLAASGMVAVLIDGDC
jgi:hypothetical protein